MALLAKPLLFKSSFWILFHKKATHCNVQDVSNGIASSFRDYTTFPSHTMKIKRDKLRKKNLCSVEKVAVVPEDNEICLKFAENSYFNFNDNLSAVLHAPRDLRLEQTSLPKCSEKEVLIATECVGLSKSDHELISRGKYKNYVFDDRFILGHEASGIIAEIGSRVIKFRPGDRVAIEPTIPCRICDFCKRGRFNLCPDIYFCGMPCANGTLSRFFAWPEDSCLKLPHHVGFDEAALLEPLAIAHHACKRGGVTVGSKVLVCGAGPMGLLNMLCAKACGATNIVITDTKSDRLRCANSMGATTIILIKKTTNDGILIKEITDALGGEAHVSLECSGSPQAVRVASEVTIPGGTMVLVGDCPPGTSIQTKCVAKEIDIRGVQNYCNNYQNALDLIATGRLDFRSMITHDYKLNDINDAIDVAKSGRAIKILIHTNPKWIPSRRRHY